MAIDIVPFTAEWEPAVVRFNRRMRDSKAPSAFDLPERAKAPKSGVVFSRNFIAVEGSEVRGGIIVLEHPAFINNALQDGGSARRETVINLQSPLSEGIIDSKYAMVSIQLIRFALKRCPYAYVVGMGSAENPLPRLLKASGWTVRPVPFFFRILRAARCLKQLKPLQRKPALKFAAMVGAYTGTGALALSVVQRPRNSTSGYRSEKVSSPGSPDHGADQSTDQGTNRGAARDAEHGTGLRMDDALWSAVEQRLSFGVVRDSSTLPEYLSARIERHRVYRGNECTGWFSMMISSMENHSYFGNLRVATLVDMVVRDPVDMGPTAMLAVECARAAACDLVVTNQLQLQAQEALRGAGFLRFSSNYFLASSKRLSAVMDDATSFVTRQDGDGLVNLRGVNIGGG